MDNATAALSLEGETLAFTGAIDGHAAERLWNDAARASAKTTTIALDQVTALDSIGAVMLLGLDKPITGAPPAVAEVLDRNRRALDAAPPPRPDKPLPFLQALGAGAIAKVKAAGNTLAYIGEVAVTMVRAPFILFLDEPSAGLDPVTSAGLDKLITDIARGTGTTFVVVTHELQSILAIGDRCIMLDKAARGMIAEGNPKDLRDHSENPTVRAFFRREAPADAAPADKAGA